MNWAHIRTIWAKEILDTIRDKRTLIAGMLVPIILMPAMSIGSMYLAKSTQTKAAEERTRINIAGAEAAPQLMRSIRASKQFREVKSAAPTKDLKDGRIELALRIPAGFEEMALHGNKPAELTVAYEAKKMTASVAVGKLRQIVDVYMTMAQMSRLGLKDPSILQTVKFVERNTSTPDEMGGMILGMILPFMLAFLGILGGMYTAIDAVAGEKERRTLETLVIAPPARSSLAMGKCLAVFTISLITVIISTSSYFLTYRYAMPMLDKTIKMTMSLNAIGMLLLVALPYVAMLSGIQVALSAFGKSFRETQNYFSGLMFVVLIPGMALMFSENALSLPLYAVPIINVVSLFKQIIMGNWQWAQILLCVASNLACMGLTLNLARKMLANEKLMFKA